MATTMSRELRRDFWILTLGQFLLFCGYFSFFEFPLFIKSVGGGETEIGFMMGVQTLAATLVMPWISPQLGRFDLKRTMFIGTAMVCVATVSALVLTAPDLLMASVMVLRGLGFSLFMNASGTYVARIVPIKERSQWLGISFGFNQIGVAVGPAIAELAIEIGGYHWFFLTSLAMVLSGLVFQLRVQNHPPTTELVRYSTLRAPLRFFGALVSRRLGYLFFTLLPLAAGLGTVFGFSATFLKGQALSSGLFFMVYAAFNATTRIGGGRLSDKYGRATVILPTLALFMLGVLIYSFTAGVTLLLISAVIIGFGFGFCNPAISAQMLDQSDPEDQSIAVGGFQFAYNLGMMLSTPVMGVIADGYGYPTMFRAGAGMGALAVLIYLVGEFLRVRSAKLTDRPRSPRGAPGATAT